MDGVSVPRRDNHHLSMGVYSIPADTDIFLWEYVYETPQLELSICARKKTFCLYTRTYAVQHLSAPAQGFRSLSVSFMNFEPRSIVRKYKLKGRLAQGAYGIVDVVVPSAVHVEAQTTATVSSPSSSLACCLLCSGGASPPSKKRKTDTHDDQCGHSSSNGGNNKSISKHDEQLQVVKWYRTPADLHRPLRKDAIREIATYGILQWCSGADDATAAIETVAHVNSVDVTTSVRNQGVAIVMPYYPHILCEVIEAAEKERVEQQRLMSRDKSSLFQKWTLSRVQGYMRDIVGALALLYQHGLVYRDLKPENIFIDPVSGRCRLADMGGVECRTSPMGARDWAYTGVTTPGFRAPELLCGIEYVDMVKADMWSLGILFLSLLLADIEILSDDACTGSLSGELEEIFALVGTPTREQWAEFYRSPLWQAQLKRPEHHPRTTTTLHHVSSTETKPLPTPTPDVPPRGHGGCFLPPSPSAVPAVATDDAVCNEDDRVDKGPHRSFCCMPVVGTLGVFSRCPLCNPVLTPVDQSLAARVRRLWTTTRNGTGDDDTLDKDATLLVSQAVDLVQNLLKVNPEDRFSIYETMRHPFICGAAATAITTNTICTAGRLSEGDDSHLDEIPQPLAVALGSVPLARESLSVCSGKVDLAKISALNLCETLCSVAVRLHMSPAATLTALSLFRRVLLQESLLLSTMPSSDDSELPQFASKQQNPRALSSGHLGWLAVGSLSLASKLVDPDCTNVKDDQACDITHSLQNDPTLLCLFAITPPTTTTHTSATTRQQTLLGTLLPLDSVGKSERFVLTRLRGALTCSLVCHRLRQRGMKVEYGSLYHMVLLFVELACERDDDGVEKTATADTVTTGVDVDLLVDVAIAFVRDWELFPRLAPLVTRISRSVPQRQRARGFTMTPHQQAQCDRVIRSTCACLTDSHALSLVKSQFKNYISQTSSMSAYEKKKHILALSGYVRW